MSAARAIATFVSQTRFDDVPPEVIERVKKSMLDVLGCAVYGLANPSSQAVRRYARAHTAATDASIFGAGGAKASCFDAALANGTSVLSTNFGEGFTRCMVHPGSSIVPALLAVGERQHLAGRDVLNAAAVAYDLLIRLGMTMGQGFVLQQGLFQPSVLGTFAAAAAVGRALACTPDEVGQILGIAACHTPTSLMKAGRALVNDTFEGSAGAIGVLAADLFVAGVTGPTEWLEPWYQAMVRDFDLSTITDRLGDYWYTSSGGLRVKTRPVMAMASPAMEAMFELLSNETIDHREIEDVLVESSARIELGRTAHPTSVESARAAIPFLVAAAFVHPQPFLADPYLINFLTDELLADEQVASLADKVRLATDPVMDYNLERAAPSTDGSSFIKFEGRVTVRLCNGTERSQYVDLFAAGTGNMSRERMEGKFRAVTAARMPTSRVEEVIGAVWRLDELEDVSALSRLMADW